MTQVSHTNPKPDALVRDRLGGKLVEKLAELLLGEQEVRSLSLAELRLEDELGRLKTAGQITDFSILGVQDNTIQVQATLPETQYTREHRLSIRQSLRASVKDLNFTISAELLPEPEHGES